MSEAKSLEGKGGAPVKEAVTMERLLIWAIRDCCADRLVQADMSREANWLGGGTSAGAVERYGRLGCRIDGGGGGVSGHRLHPDAEAVYDAVPKGGWPGRLILGHARAGTRPDWMPSPAPLRLVPKRSRPRFERDRHGNAILCLLEEIGDRPETVAARRAVYRTWRAGLREMAWTFMNEPARLKDHRVIGTGPSEAPWLSAKKD